MSKLQKKIETELSRYESMVEAEEICLVSHRKHLESAGDNNFTILKLQSEIVAAEYRIAVAEAIVKTLKGLLSSREISTQSF